MNIDNDRLRLPDDLRDSLRALRRDAAPEHDLWPGIRARIEQARPAHSPAPAATATPLPTRIHGGQRRRPRRLAALATAASLAAVLAIGWSVLMAPPAQSPQTAAGVILREASHMTREYRTAWRAFDARRPAGVDTSALREIDRSAAAVRAALRQDPDSRYLLDRLQSLYALRLDLSRRLSTLPT
ncbi:hypothetical protein [Luteimonas lutimaris]|uniref:DUF3379 domain-containing protein n=1 Tax=Luteimonas lutimaris TaxID=698645 RepID=A0ABP7MCS3_9GAMM